jgi:hypothetical protein
MIIVLLSKSHTNFSMTSHNKGHAKERKARKCLSLARVTWYKSHQSSRYVVALIEGAGDLTQGSGPRGRCQEKEMERSHGKVGI